MIEYAGIQYARVSDIIRPFVDFSHIDPEVLQRKADLGSQVHEAIDDFLKGSFPCLSRKALGYFDSFRQWFYTLHPRFLVTEQRYYHKELRLTGQIDAIVVMPHEKVPVLVDYKTSSQESPVSWSMQAHLYKMLLLHNGHPVADRFLFLRLHKDGELPKAHIYHYDKDTETKCLMAISKFWKKKENNTCIDKSEEPV